VNTGDSQLAIPVTSFYFGKVAPWSSNSNSNLYKPKWHRSQCRGQRLTRVRCARVKTRRELLQGVFDPSKISGVGTIFGQLVHVLLGPKKQRALNQVRFWAELGDKTIRPVTSFVLGIHFTNSYFCDSRGPFGQTDNRKQMLGRFRSYFQKMYWRVDLKKASRPFYFCKLDLMGHRWAKVMIV
jgi:hypothetical protein